MKYEYYESIIDEDLVGTIYTLNEKGYETVACCQGHPNGADERKGWNAYIYFKNKHDFLNNPPPLYKVRKKGTRFSGRIKAFSDIYTIKREGGFGIYWSGDRNIPYERQCVQRTELMIRLRDWAESLPNNIL